eukprot:gene44904-59939_t
MISKNIQKRPGMEWLVMDMTTMNFQKDSFDIVFDKGALDALMSINTPEVHSKALLLFQEIQRVIKPGGKYICITLAEDFIINALL